MDVKVYVRGTELFLIYVGYMSLQTIHDTQADPMFLVVEENKA